MQITDVRIRLITNDSKLKAFASVTFDNEFVVHDIKIISGHYGNFIAMPNRKVGEAEYRDVAHPITFKTRYTIKKAVFDKYEEVLKAGNNRSDF